MKISKLFFILTFVLLFSVFTFPQKTLAQESPLLEFQQNLLDEDPNNDQFIGGKITKEGKKLNGVVDALVLKAIALTAGLPDETGKINGGVLSFSGTTLAYLFDNSPASSVTYFADVLNNTGIVKPAYAQGVGFSGLSPVLSLWKITRNFAYVLIAVLSVILGMMMMFRVKLSPQSVVSVQNAIPKIVTVLIFITFSYALAGLMIDVGNLFLILVVRILSETGKVAAPTASNWLNAGIGEIVINVINNLVSGVVALAFSRDFLALTASGGAIGIIGTVIPLVATAGLSTGIALAAIAALLAGVLIAILGLILRIIIMMIKAYVSIILGVVFGPIQLVFDVIPGQKSSAVKSWAKSLFANILIFPTVAILFIFCDFFDAFFADGQEMWSPPGFSSSNLVLRGVVKIGVLIIMPNVDKIIMQALDIKTSLGSAIGKGELLEHPDRYYRGEIQRGVAEARRVGYRRVRGTPTDDPEA